MKTDPHPSCPVARMEPLAREFLAQCHAEAHHRRVKAGQPPVPCLYCARGYGTSRRLLSYWCDVRLAMAASSC